MQRSSKIYIQTIVTDNSNPQYQGAIILIYWRLIVTCTNNITGKIYSVEREYSTEFTPSYNENFIPLLEIDENIMSNWIIQTIGQDVYDVLVNETGSWLCNQSEPPIPSDTIVYYFYDTNLNKWQSQQ